MQNLPSNLSASPAVMATEEYVRRTDMARTPRRKPNPVKRYRAPAKQTVKRRYRYTRRPNNAIQIEIPDCSQHFIKALYDPWAVPAGVCIPCDLFPLPSQKVMVKKRFTVTLSSNGCGWVLFNGSMANDIGCARYTTAGSLGGVDSAFDAGASWTTADAFYDTLPYSNADIVTNKTVQARLVAAGIRARYVGIEDKRGGSYVSCEEQDHQDLYGSTQYNTINKLKGISNTFVTAPQGDGNWDISACYSGPIKPEEIAFQNDAYPGTNSNWLAIAFAGTSDMAGQLVDVEICSHIEYIGRKVPGKTVSHADAKTYGKVLEVTKEHAAIRPLEPSSFPDSFSQFISKVVEAAPKLISVGLSAAQSIATRNPLPLLAAGSQFMTAQTGHNERLMIKG